jgi:hypothetical protein
MITAKTNARLKRMTSFVCLWFLIFILFRVLIVISVSEMNISLYSVDYCFQLIANFGSNLL